MKAYLIKVTLEESTPLIWRKIIVPADITFKTLHDIIQISMGWKDSYLYDFNIKEERLRITCDEETIYEYQLYSKMKLTEKNDPNGYVRKMIEIKPKHSRDIKIDQYLTKWNSIEYIYDFGDYWRHNIALEEIIEDYNYDYPKCIEAEGVCPPEDIGGILGYLKFLEIINNKNHCDYEKLKEWAHCHNYKEVIDIEHTNISLSKMNLLAL
ncbi:MAG: plasmid pRiA4b ORF-3 family protein [Clostridiaceae bacterium]